MNSQMMNTIKEYFSSQPVKRVWLFGSFSRGEEKEESDVDLLVSFDKDANVSLLRHAAMYLDLKSRLGREVDLVTEGTLLPFAQKTADKDKILIYERED